MSTNETTPTTTPTVSAQYLYSGLVDYWGGDGDRWDDNKGCLFASYGPTTTLRELVDEFVQDYISGGDTDNKPAFDDVDADMVRAALLAMLTDKGREDYESNAVCEFALNMEQSDEDEDDDREWPVVIVLLVVEQPDAEGDI